MTPDDIAGRLINPGVMLTMVLAGLAYSRLLWSLNLRPTGVLVVTAVAPGAIYLLTIWAIRAVQGTASLVWPTLLLDWLVFSMTAVIAVLVARRRHR